MSGEALGFSGKAQEANNEEGVRAQFTLAGSPSPFPIEDLAVSLSNDSLRNILSDIRPLELKSKKALKTEEVNKMPIELLMFRNYWVDNKSVTETARIIGWSPGGIEKIMQRSGIPRRDISTARKIQYGNPHRRQELLAKIHSPKAKKIRSESLARFHKEHPDVSSKMTDNANRSRRKNLAQQEQEALGLYPSFALFQLHYIEVYSVGQISGKTGLSESRLRGLMRKYGVKNLDKPLERESKFQAVVNKSIDVFYKREAELNPKEEYVIYRRYVAPEYKRVALEEVGVELGYTRERIRQIEEDAIGKLSSIDSKS